MREQSDLTIKVKTETERSTEEESGCASPLCSSSRRSWSGNQLHGKNYVDFILPRGYKNKILQVWLCFLLYSSESEKSHLESLLNTISHSWTSVCIIVSEYLLQGHLSGSLHLNREISDSKGKQHQLLLDQRWEAALKPRLVRILKIFWNMRFEPQAQCFFAVHWKCPFFLPCAEGREKNRTPFNKNKRLLCCNKI